MVLLNKTSNIVIDSLERFFLWWGKFVANHPYPVIFSCILATALSSLGFLRFRMEHRANLLWIPSDSPYNINEDWLETYFKKDERNQIVFFQSENVLTPTAINQMFDIYQRIKGIEVDGKTFNNLCATVPIADIFQTKRRRKREVELSTNSTDSINATNNASTNDTATDTGDYEDYDIWGYDYYDDTNVNESEAISTVQRINFEKYGSKSSDSSEHTDTINGLPDNIYCDLVTTLNEKCILTNLLEIWQYKEDLIRSTTTQEILDAVNLLVKSPWFGYDADYTRFLGGVQKNSSGHVVAAKSTQMIWKLRLPKDSELVDSQGSGLELELADETTLAWEEAFVETVLNISRPDAIATPNAAKSFGDISSQAIFFDAWLMVGGYLLMFTYTILMLGKLNCLEARVYLSISGLVSIFMGLGLAIGLSSLLGYPYTPMHAALPFLCLGIGIDDMFVIVQCWSNMKKDPSSQGLDITEQMGMAIKHAGVSITVTSLTDVFAFGVGAVTKMPGLESFCVCTAIGLGSIYLLQVSWFVAWMTLDEQRVENARNALLPCISHSRSASTSSSSELRSVDLVTKLYSKLLSSNLFKLLALLVTVTLLAFGAWGWSGMKQKFDPILLLPSESYLRDWVRVQQKFYPDNGWSAHLYSAELSHKDLANVDKLTVDLETLTKDGRTLRVVNSWWTKLKEFAEETTNHTSWHQFANEDDFPVILSDFLFSSHGTQYKPNFKFEGELRCNQKAPKITATKFEVAYYHFDGPESHIPARAAVSRVIESANSPYTFSHSKVYAAWETDEIIGHELWRNVGLAMICVFVVTMLLLCNIQICLMVIMIVVFTLTDIIGFLHFWHITIDIISCVNIVLAIGLCVDYSVHIGHAFMVAKGTRQEKAVQAISSIGPAVFNGGFTTFLALVLCSFSSSHVFITFFKVFALTVVFGLFHGLIMFPVVLSLLGPVDKDPSDALAQSSLTITTLASSTESIAAQRKHNVLHQHWVTPNDSKDGTKY